MADTSSYRVPAGSPIAEDDPFAELTRIMGFDPREKVARQQPVEPDFGIDLERELMGDFASEQDNEPAVAPPVESAAPYRAPEVSHAEARQEPQFAAVDPFEEPAAEVAADHSFAAADEAPDPFADFDLAFEEEAPEATAVAGGDLSAPEAVDADEAAYDEDVELAFAALEAWEQGRGTRGAAEKPVLDERQIAGFAPVEAPAEPVQPEVASAPESGDVSDLTSDFAPELFAPAAEEAEEAVADPQETHEPDLDFELTSEDVFATEAEAGLQAEDEPVAASSDERDRFTAEEGWTDEATVSLDEPQVLEASYQEPVIAEVAEDQLTEAELAIDLDEAQAAAVAQPSHEQSVDDEFEQELFDLLGGAPVHAGAVEIEAAAENDDWFERIDLNDVPASAVQEEAVEEPEAAHAAERQPVEPEAEWQWAEDSVAEFEAELAAQNDAEAEAEVVEAEAPVQAAPAAPSWQYQPAQIYGARAYAETRVDAPAPEVAAQPDTAAVAQVAAGPEAVDDLDAQFEDLDLLDLSLDDLEDHGEADEPATAAHEASVTAAMAAAAHTDTDPADEPSATPDTEPEAMQPYNERAFDAALADEFASPSDDHRNWHQRQHEDPFAFTPVSQSQAANYAPRQRPVVNAPGMHAEVPDIETVDFVDSRVAHSDELDLPEVDYGHHAKQPAGQFDDFDAEFASAFNALNEEPQPAAAQAEPQQRQAGGQTWDDNFEWGVAGAGAAAATAASASTLSRAGLYDPQDEDAYQEEQVYRSQRSRKPALSRKAIVGAAVAALVVIGGIVFIAMPGSPIGSGEPAILRADSDPLKVRPENPGGATVPNQNNVVYDRVGTSQPLATPTQERLITSAEEPVDLAAGEDDEGPMAGMSALDDEGEMVGSEEEDVAAKAEDRITPDQTDAASDVPQEMIAVAPRRVRTMMVRSDGTLVPREEATAEPVSVATAAQAAIEPEPTVAAPTAPAPRLPEPAPVAAAPVAAPQPAPAPAPVAQTPAPQVAAVQPAAGAAQVVDAATAPAGWSVQIASQPSEAGAQSTYQDLARRYASVLNGRGVNIVKAEIAGKGTYYRVRIPASSRSDANSICANFKSAGGSCFVSQ